MHLESIGRGLSYRHASTREVIERWRRAAAANPMSRRRGPAADKERLPVVRRTLTASPQSSGILATRYYRLTRDLPRVMGQTDPKTMMVYVDDTPAECKQLMLLAPDEPTTLDVDRAA